MAVMENWTQVAFRYRDDDGTETTATWRQDINVDDTLELDTTYRMRIGVQGTHTGGSASFDLTVGFQYQVDAGGWNDITTSSANVKSVASDDVSIDDDDVTTEQLAQSATFVAGHMDETGTTSAINLSETEETECELVFQLDSGDLSGGEAVEIKIVDSGSDLATYNQTPSITVASEEVVIRGGSFLLALAHHQANARAIGSKPPAEAVEEVVLIYTKMLTGVGR